MIMPDHGAYLAALDGDRQVNTPALRLLLKPWLRMAHAEHGALYHKVQIELLGIPLQAWSSTTVADLLRPYCSIESVHPATRSRQDLSTF